ncbi:MAG: hypothetical protein ABEN55_17850 [Bradymonadaceae bacterium]
MSTLVFGVFNVSGRTLPLVTKGTIRNPLLSAPIWNEKRYLMPRLVNPAAFGLHVAPRTCLTPPKVSGLGGAVGRHARTRPDTVDVGGGTAKRRRGIRTD